MGFLKRPMPGERDYTSKACTVWMGSKGWRKKIIIVHTSGGTYANKSSYVYVQTYMCNTKHEKCILDVFPNGKCASALGIFADGWAVPWHTVVRTKVNSKWVPSSLSIIFYRQCILPLVLYSQQIRSICSLYIFVDVRNRFCIDTSGWMIRYGNVVGNHKDSIPSSPFIK